MLSDVRHAVRSILRMPVLSAIVVLSLAAGIGVNTVVFSWVQARILQPIPGVPDGADVRLIEPKSDGGGYPGSSWPEYLDLRERLRTFSTLFAARIAPFYVGEPGSVERIFGVLASDNYFPTLGMRPAIGRFFQAQDIQSNEPVVVVSHRLWTTHFGGSANVVGRTLRINGRAVTVIGVAPPEFQGTVVGLQFDAWVPAALARTIVSGSRELEDRDIRGYSVMGRLAPGVSMPQAQADVTAVMTQLAQEHPRTNAQFTAEVLPFYSSPRGPQRLLNLALAVLQAVMLLLLLAVCGNVANLMLARASARQKEMGIRLSLGAQPRRIASLLLTESVLLALGGAAAGAAMAMWGTRALLIMPMTGLPLRFETSIDATGLAFAIGLGVLCGFLFGAAPAWHLARTDPHLLFRAGARAGGRSRLRRALMGVQVALAIMVLIVAGTFFRAFLETRSTDTGFDRDRVMLAAYDVSGREVDAAFSRTLATRTLEKIGALPFVEAVAVASSVPLDIHGMPTRGFTIEGHVRDDGKQDQALTNTVTPGYFGVMGIPIVAGTDFSPLRDVDAPRQAIVNEAFVQRFVSSGTPLGRQVRSRNLTFTISGVVRNSLYNAFGEPPTPVVYLSYRDVPQPRGEIHVRFRVGTTGSAAAEIGRAMRDVDADLPVFNTRTMTQHVDTNLIFRKIPAQMFAVLGPMLLALAAVGIYGVVSYAVSLRTREIGVRLAIGATAERVVGTFVRESLSVAFAGAAIGWGIAFFVASRLAPPGALDLVVFAVVPLVLMAVAAVASWIPARRAAQVDPAVTLRAD